MSKLTIRNYAAPQWTAVLESRARLGLGSISAESRRVTIELQQVPHNNDAFTCSLSFTLINGNKQTLANTQPKAVAAIDGVIARARRTIARRRLMPAGTVTAVVSPAGAGSVPFR
ncbi:MAG: hypothetical protein ACI9NT_001153 [Bacteroidia bacterium]|jgi:hypothetical protein